MTSSDLEQLIASAEWFSQLGQFPDQDGYLTLRDLEEPGEEDPEDDWDWLPTDITALDPFHPVPLKQVATEQGRQPELLETTKRFYKSALAGLRGATDHPLLKVGASDWGPAAQGAALFAVRMATAEVITEIEGPWITLIRLYAQGYWPCGLRDNGDLVVL